MTRQRTDASVYSTSPKPDHGPVAFEGSHLSRFDLVLELDSLFLREASRSWQETERERIAICYRKPSTVISHDSGQMFGEILCRMTPRPSTNPFRHGRLLMEHSGSQKVFTTAKAFPVSAAFDVDTLKYQSYSPAEIWPWSATAMLVEPETIWIGLARNGEYGGSSGGILRYDRATEKVERTDFKDAVLSITRTGKVIALGTDFGAAVLENGTLHRYFISPGLDRRLQVSEALIGN